VTRRVSAPHLVDRAEERAQLTVAWVEAVAGTPRTVLVTGEAGIGKTRLLDTLAEDLTRTDALVLRANCVPLGSHSTAYAPLRMVVSDLASEVGHDAVRRMAGGSGALSRLLPDLPEQGRPAGPDGWVDNLADVMARLLHAASAQRPVAVLVDDMHWADPASRDVVGYVARMLRTSRLLLVASLRSEAGIDSAVQDLVDELIRLPSVERLWLQRLDGDAVVAQMTGILGSPPDAAFAEQVRARSQGVPFLVEELTAAGKTGDQAVPQNLRDVLLHGMRRLSTAATAVLRATAAAGGPVDEGMLVAVSRMDLASLRPALRELVEHQLLTVDRREGRYDFCHALLREAVADDLLPGEAESLHERYAILAEQQDEHGGSVVAAHHWWEARNAARAYPALLAAAAVARSSSAYGEELLLLERARTLWPDVEGVATEQPLELGALLATTGRAARLAGQYELARDLLSEARRRLAPSAGHLPLAEVLWEESLLLRSLGTAPGVEVAVQALLDELPATPSKARAHALNAQLQFQLHRRETHEAQATLRAAVEAADLAGEPAVAAHLRVTGAGLQLDEGALSEQAQASLGESWLVAEQLDDVPLMLRVLDMQARLHQARGDFRSAAQDARHGLRLAAERGSPVLILDYLVGGLCDAMIAVGSWAEALHVLEDALAVDRPNLERAGLHARLASVRAATGDATGAREALATAARRLERGPPDPSLVVVVATAEADVSLWEGRPSAAVDSVKDGYVGSGGHVGPHLVWPLLRAAAAAATAVPRRGRTLPIDWLAHAVDRQQERDPLSWWPLVLRAYLSEGDTGLWDSAVSATTGVEVAVLVRLQVLLAAASAHAAAGSRDRAAGLLADVLIGARTIGATPLLEAAAALAERARLRVEGLGPDPKPARTQPDPDGLTSREVEVLALLATGRSNRQIAADLVISAKTVSVHVSHILDKLGVTSRGEAAATARARRLLGERSD